MLIIVPSKASEPCRFSWGKWLDSALCRSVYLLYCTLVTLAGLLQTEEREESPAHCRVPGNQGISLFPTEQLTWELLAQSVLIVCWSVLSLGTWPFNILQSLLLAKSFQAFFSRAMLCRQKACVRTSCHILFIFANGKSYLLISDDVISTEQDREKQRAYPEEFIILRTNVDETTCTWKTLK